MYDLVNGLQFREVGAETLVYDTAHEKVHVVNKTAADLLQACAGKSDADLVDYLRSSYDVAGHQVENDVSEIMDAFVEQGLVFKVAS
jgi:hypothetical protein